MVIGTLNVMESCRMFRRDIGVYHAGSSECFGDTSVLPATETTPLQPRSPYAVAKACAFWLVNSYRETYGLFACTGILFNHESPLRPQRFVTQKIVSAARRIADGSGEKLRLGRIVVRRDWGWASEYVEAMWRMLQQDEPDDFVVATGQTSSLEDFVAVCFPHLGLDWRDHVVLSPALRRPADLEVSQANPIRCYEKLGWRASIRMPNVAIRMLESQY